MSQPVLTITHRMEFSGAHRMDNPELSKERNEEVFGVCNRVHGHNYTVEASLAGPLDPETGMVANLVDLMRVMREEVFEQLDHRLLNEVPWLQGGVVSAETLAVALWERIGAREAELGAPLVCIRVCESVAAWAEYRGPNATA